MAKIEVPELTQVLGQVSNASVILVHEVRTAVQISTGLLQNVTSAMSDAIMELSSAIKGINSVMPEAIAKTSGSVQSSIDLNSPAVHFALTTLAIFLIVSTIFCLFAAMYKGVKTARFVVDWCNQKQTSAPPTRTPLHQGSIEEKQMLRDL